MADDNAKLLIVLEAQSKKLQNQLVDATRTIDRFAAQTNRRFDQMNAKNAASFDKLNRRVGVSLGALQAGIARAFAGAAALRGAQVLVDAATRIENSLKIAGLSGEALTQVYDELFESAQRNAAPVESLVDLYGKLAQVQKELGASGADLLSFTDNIAVALRVSGKSAAESSGALMQLSQALGGGTVRAEEFNSILEGALPIAQAAAAGLEEAGGSVAKLRLLIIEGKVSSEAFFRAFEAGAVILQEKVANAELTVSQQFVRLQNVLIDVAGKFDDATGASNRVGDGLNNLATFIERVGTVIAANKENIGWLVDKIGEAATTLPGVGTFLNSLESLNLAFDVELQTEAARQEAERFAAETEAMFAEAISGATLMLDEWRMGWGETLPPELQASVEALIAQVKVGGDEAKIAQSALMELGGTGTPFTEALGHLNTLVSELQRVRGEANATAVAVAQAARPNVAGLPQSYAGQEGAPPPKVVEDQITLEQYPVGGVSSGSGGGSKQSPGEKFQESLDRQAEENRLLAEKTALQATLNPLVNDYDAAMSKLQVTQDLQSAAMAAGIEITPELAATIEELANTYSTATVEAGKLAEAQENARQSMQDWFDVGRDAARGFIDDLRDSKTAAEALGNVFNKLGDQLLNMGLGALFGTGGGNFGLFGQMFGFATGGYTGNGGKYDPAGVVHKGEYVFTKEQTARLGVGNLSRLAKGYANGGLVGAPAPMTRAANDSSPIITFAPVIDARGADVAAVARLEQALAKQSVELEGKVKHIVKTRGTKWR